MELGVRVFIDREQQNSQNIALGATNVKDINVQQNPHGYLIGTSKALVYVPREVVWTIDAITSTPQNLAELVQQQFDTHQLDILLSCLREGLEGAEPKFKHVGEARAILAQLKQLRKTLGGASEEKEK